MSEPRASEASRMEAAGVEPAKRSLAKLVMAREFWSKPLTTLQVTASRWSTGVPLHARLSTVVMETSWRREDGALTKWGIGTSRLCQIRWSYCGRPSCRVDRRGA